MKPLAILGLALAATAATVTIDARRTVEAPATAPAPPQDDTPYDGRYTFARIQFGGGGGGLRDLRGFGRREPPWAHDHPRADRNFSSILGELTFVDTDADNIRVLRMDDPEVFKYPVIYVVEVGSWDASREEVDALGEFLGKGGFMIVDDFRDRQIYQLQSILAEALPGMEILEVPDDHEIFDSFYFIEDPHSLIPPYGGNRPIYFGVFEDNDITKRLMAILNYNNDIAEYWEFSDQGFYPIDLANEAYQFGVNYVMYALTH